MHLPPYEDLSPDQDAVLRLPTSGSYLVVGPPGTGKTILALYRAKILAEAGHEPRLLTYGRLLSQYVENAATKLGISTSVTTFHSWFRDYYKSQYGKKPPTVEPWKYDWAAILRTLATQPPEPLEVDRIVLDEAQDLPSEFVATLRTFMRGQLTVFADENQRITETQSTIQELLGATGIAQDAIVHVRTNHRNTREVALLARHFYSGSPSELASIPDRTGPTPRIVSFDKREREIERIFRHAYNFSQQSVGVFVEKRSQQQEIFDQLRARFHEEGYGVAEIGSRVQTYNWDEGHRAIDFSEPGVRIVNYMSAKGLEFDTVFVPMLETVNRDMTLSENRMLFYVLVSRAKRRLILSYVGGGRPPAARECPPDLVDFKTNVV